MVPTVPPSFLQAVEARRVSLHSNANDPGGLGRLLVAQPSTAMVRKFHNVTGTGPPRSSGGGFVGPFAGPKGGGLAKVDDAEIKHVAKATTTEIVP